jgi:hypothetical protein
MLISLVLLACVTPNDVVTRISGLPEVCDGRDNDGNGAVDDVAGDVTVSRTWDGKKTQVVATTKVGETSWQLTDRDADGSWESASLHGPDGARATWILKDDGVWYSGTSVEKGEDGVVTRRHEDPVRRHTQTERTDAQGRVVETLDDDGSDGTIDTVVRRMYPREGVEVREEDRDNDGDVDARFLSEYTTTPDGFESYRSDDYDADGVADSEERVVKTATGERMEWRDKGEKPRFETVTRQADGITVIRTVEEDTDLRVATYVSTSADGAVKRTETDRGEDGRIDVIRVETTDADGTVTTTIDTNADGAADRIETRWKSEGRHGRDEDADADGKPESTYRSVNACDFGAL